LDRLIGPVYWIGLLDRETHENHFQRHCIVRVNHLPVYFFSGIHFFPENFLKNHGRQSIMDQFTFSTAFGYVGIVYRQKPFFLLEIRLPIAAGANHYSPLRSPDPRVVQLSECICRYFGGAPLDPHWNLLDLNHLTPLQQEVLRATAQIPFGQTRTYQDIAKAVNRPRAGRFVGNTLAQNPFPILIPCHRVIRSDGAYGGFGGGRDLKKKMIEHETRHSGSSFQEDVG
jgi:methylated-DNA-[protein]-cysteine S-methyltransferase